MSGFLRFCQHYYVVLGYICNKVDIMQLGAYAVDIPVTYT